MRVLGLGLGVLALSQGVQGLPEAFGEDKRGFGLPARQEADALGNEQLRLHLGAGTGGDLEKAAELFWGVAGEPLRNIGRDGDGGTAKLIRERKALFWRQDLAEFVDLDNQVHPELPYIQVSEA